MSCTIRDINFTLSEEGWINAKTGRVLTIQIESSSDSSNILSISYIYIARSGARKYGKIDYTLIDIMCASIVYDADALWTSDDDATLRFRLDYIISKLDTDEMESLSYISRHVLNSKNEDCHAETVTESFLIGMSLYLCIIDMSKGDGVEVFDLIGINVDFMIPEIAANIFDQSYFKYMGMILHATQVTGSYINNELASVLISFINGWCYNFASVLTVDIHEPLFNLTLEVFSKLMKEMRDSEKRLEHTYMRYFKNMEKRLSELEDDSRKR